MTAPFLATKHRIAKDHLCAWFEMHGAVRDKLRKTIKKPDLRANKLQRDFARVQEICRRDKRPCRIITLKGRQQGSSTISVAALCHMMRQEAVRACIIGDEFEKSVKNLVAMFDFYVAEDTLPWGNSYNPAAKKFSNGSELATETANDPRAGASGTLQAVLATEVAWWKETGVISAKGTMAALLNCVPDTPGTLVIVESTPNGAAGIYYETFIAAVSVEDYEAGRIPENWNGFFRLTYWWHEHPEYDLPDTTQEEEQIIRASITEREQELIDEHELPISRLAWRRQKIASPAFNGDEDKFEQEYPSDHVKCFLLSGRRVFPAYRIQEQMRACKLIPHHKIGLLNRNEKTQAVLFQETADDEGVLRLYEDRIPGRRYSLIIDPATGASQTTGADPDSHAPIVIRWGYFDEYGAWVRPKVAARLCSVFDELRDKQAVCRWDVDVLVNWSFLLATYYGKCPIIVEMNKDSGAARQLYALGANMYFRQQWNRAKQETTKLLGWMTAPNASASGASRNSIIEELKTSIRQGVDRGGGIDLSDPLIIRQLDTFVVDKDGKPQAASGAHDDLVLALAIGVATKECATVYSPTVKLSKWDAWEDDDSSNSKGTYS